MVNDLKQGVRTEFGLKKPDYLSLDGPIPHTYACTHILTKSRYTYDESTTYIRCIAFRKRAKRNGTDTIYMVIDVYVCLSETRALNLNSPNLNESRHVDYYAAL